MKCIKVYLAVLLSAVLVLVSGCVSLSGGDYVEGTGWSPFLYANDDTLQAEGATKKYDHRRQALVDIGIARYKESGGTAAKAAEVADQVDALIVDGVTMAALKLGIAELGRHVDMTAAEVDLLSFLAGEATIGLGNLEVPLTPEQRRVVLFYTQAVRAKVNATP